MQSTHAYEVRPRKDHRRIDLISIFPTAKAVPGKPGYVSSPFDTKGRYIDVSGYPPGSKVKDRGPTRSSLFHRHSAIKAATGAIISDRLAFVHLCYGGPNAASNAIGYAQHYSRSHHAVIRVYDAAGNVIETHEHKGDFKEW
jgi:hypothetical protein